MAAVAERVCSHLFFPLCEVFILPGSVAHKAILESERFMHSDHLRVLAMTYRAGRRCRRWQEDRHTEP